MHAPGRVHALRMRTRRVRKWAVDGGREAATAKARDARQPPTTSLGSSEPGRAECARPRARKLKWLNGQVTIRLVAAVTHALPWVYP